MLENKQNREEAIRMSEYLIGDDAGNTSSKVVIFDKNGTIMSIGKEPPACDLKKRAVF